MSNRSLIWAFTFVWLLGPIEPVFADNDIAGQFPDVVSHGLVDRNGRVWAQEMTGQSARGYRGADPAFQSSGNSGPWDVEMWSRGRRRTKHFRSQSYANGYNVGNGYQSAYSNNPGSNFNGGNNYNAGYSNNPGNSYNFGNNISSSNNNRLYDRDIPNQRLSALTASTSYRSNGTMVPIGGNYNDALVNASPKPYKPDKFAETPMVDDSGIRHFGNGRHHDLNAVPMEQALSDSAASDEQLRQDQAAERARVRDQKRRRNNFNF